MSSTKETILRYSSCTPHRPKTRYHIIFEDFVEIGGDIYNAHALRAFENATNQRICQLREQYGISETDLPHEDDLWIAMPYRALEALTLKAVTKSTCQRILAEEAIEDAPPSLLELGFLRRRFAARRTGEGRKRPLTTIYEDADGEFILVDEHGNYIDLDGKVCSAMMVGFCLIERQYLYCIEQINAAIAALDSLSPPQALPRCDTPMIRRCVPRRQKSSVATKETAQETTIPCDAQRDANNRRSLARTVVARRGTNPYATYVNAHDSTDIEDVSSVLTENLLKMEKPVRQLHGPLYRNTIELTSLRSAPWTPETIIGLASCVLDVPAKPDDEETLQRWLADWYEPAARLLAGTRDLSPQLAWERIDLTTRYMATPGSPSWWQRPASEGGRKTKVPVTLKNVADRLVIEYADFDRHRNQWWPSETSPYDGPPPMEYEAGYESPHLTGAPAVEAAAAGQVTAITEVSGQATKSNEEQHVPAEVRPQVQSLPRRAAEGVADTIHRECPTLLLGLDEVAVDRFMVFFEYGPDDQWEPIDLVTWYAPPPETQRRIGQALEYAASLESGGDDPSPEQVESEETSDQQGENRADHRAGAVQTAVGSS